MSTLRELLEQIRDRMGVASASSVEIKTSTRGADVAVKSYSLAGVREAGDAALDEWRRVHEQLNNQGVDAFGAELARRQRAG